jgi:hypothetical protein
LYDKDREQFFVYLQYLKRLINPLSPQKRCSSLVAKGKRTYHKSFGESVFSSGISKLFRSGHKARSSVSSFVVILLQTLIKVDFLLFAPSFLFFMLHKLSALGRGKMICVIKIKQIQKSAEEKQKKMMIQERINNKSS